jgi:hypothetical protein
VKDDGRNSLTGEEYFPKIAHKNFINRTFTGLLHASRSITYYFTLQNNKMTAQFKSDY